MTRSSSNDEDIARKAIEDIGVRFAKTVSSAFSGVFAGGTLIDEKANAWIASLAEEESTSTSMFTVCDSAGQLHEYTLSEHVWEVTGSTIIVRQQPDKQIVGIFFNTRYLSSAAR